MSGRLKIGLWIAGAVVLTVLIATTIASIEISHHARDWVDDWLTQVYKSDVDLSAFRVSIPFPLVQVEGENLALHFQGRQDLPPLMSVRRFTVRTSLWRFLGNPRYVQFVHVEGLQINVPPRDGSNRNSTAKRAMGRLRSVHFGAIVSENAVLKILTSKPDKRPLEFDIQHVNLRSSDKDGGLEFRATLSNPTPPGQILSSGTFGPWNGDNPRLTPVSGGYTFEKADLGVFAGIRGILSSAGKYHGVLEQIYVDGTTDTPDFQVSRAGHPLDLSTTFQATVDGTNGDTYLHPVEAHFGKSTLLAQGRVEGEAGKPGKTITLDVSADRARIEDLLQLAVKGSASMLGPIRLKTKFILAPGTQEIPDRLNLNGSFALDSVHFTNPTVQQKFDNMSKRSLGKPKEIKAPEDADHTDDVASMMNGTFRLENGILTLPNVKFQVPGADVSLRGTYKLAQEDLDLHGKLEMKAKLSQTTTGAKSLFLKVVDPFFSKGDKGTVLPIKITGSLQHLSYGLDRGHKDDTNTTSR
jgi:hypothetical protein